VSAVVRSAGAPRPRGRHLLRSRSLAAAIVRDAGVERGDLVLDLGAGSGMLTRALADAGAHVVAVELDALLARDLRRVEGDVSVIQGDARELAWPCEPFKIVANLPFAHGTELLRALLGDPSLPLRSVDAIVQWELAEKRSRAWPSTLLSVLWGAWYELRLARRIAPAAFAPPPAVGAAVLRATRRPESLVPPEQASAYAAFVRRNFADLPLRRTLPRRATERALNECGADRDARGRDLDAPGWALLFRSVRRTR
jgi:23S rRNA (adenine-N6)-dimethyltransferase